MKVNEIFYSLQGEGRYTGTPAAFVRLSGCNLACDFCDTQHSKGIAMSEGEIVAEVAKYPSEHVIITGGEPTLQLTLSLVQSLHEAGKRVHIETNGTLAVDEDLLAALDWITCSPKSGNTPNIQRIDELKVVYDIAHPEHIAAIENVPITDINCYYLQPCDRGDEDYNAANLASCIKYIMKHPKWKLSLQTHKMLNLR